MYTVLEGNAVEDKKEAEKDTEAKVKRPSLNSQVM